MEARHDRRGFFRVVGGAAISAALARLVGPAAIGAAASGCAGGSGGAAGGAGGASSPGVPGGSGTTFPIPPLLDPLPDPNTGVRSFRLQLHTDQVRFFGAGGAATATYGIGSLPYLGPTLRMSQGDTVEIAVDNGIGRDTTMHWHGVHVPSDMDGGPHQLIAAGGSWTARYSVVQRASTCWYHPHPHGETGEQVYHGLAGMLWIDDAESRALGLPSDYGVDDIPVVIQDRSFDASGAFSYQPLSHFERNRGKLGSTPLVNGVLDPLWEAPRQVVRLRLLNGSNARVYRVVCPQVNMHAIAGDGSLLAQPVTVSELRLSPGERAEIVLDLTSQPIGSDVVLRDNATGWTLLTIRVTRPAVTGAMLPSTLSTTLGLPTVAGTLPTRSFRFGRDMGMGGKFTINGVPMDPNLVRIDQRVPVGTLELWTVQNPMGMVHNFHVHGTSFAVLRRLDGSGRSLPIEAHETAWKDTVYTGPGETVELLVRFAERTRTKPNGDPAPFMFHCHVLEHEDWGMMGQFVVV